MAQLSRERYIEQIADTHGIAGYCVGPDERIVYATYREDSYDLRTSERWLTDTEANLTFPESLDGRGTVVALRDREGNEQHDLVEVDPDDGDSRPILDDEFFNVWAQPSPTDPSTIAFVSNRDGSLDLYTVDVETGDVTRRSQTERTVRSYAWSPDGGALLYQTALIDDSGLRLADLSTGTDEAFIDNPDSEQSIGYFDSASTDVWTDRGILFTTNHETGYREVAVADVDGDYELIHATGTDKYGPKWTDAGDIVFYEVDGGNRALRRWRDGTVTTIEPTGQNTAAKPLDAGVQYLHESTDTAGALKRDGDVLVDEGAVDVPTVAPAEVTYESADGTEIAARRYTPEGEPIAAVVKPHGGPPAQHYNSLNSVVQTLVHTGFEVLAPDFRGSIGYGRGFRKATDGDIGGPDLEDVVAGAEYLRERGHDSVGITGGSYGGYLTLMAVGATDAFEAGASVCGVVNWQTTVENGRQFLGDYMFRKLGGTPDDRPDLYADRSPITYIDDITVPLLVVQGANDPRVPESEAEQLIDSLDERDIPYEYLLFEDEGHGVVKTENRVEYVSRIVEFFESNLVES